MTDLNQPLAKWLMDGDPQPPLGPVGFAHVAAFARVVDAGSFTAAAHQMGLSKATISKQIAHLEHKLGACLLARTTRSLRLTDVGARFYSHCRNILDEWAIAETEILELNGTSRGRLRVCAPSYFGNQRLLPALCAFMQRYPGIEIELVLADESGEQLDDGVDVAIRVGPRTSSSDQSNFLAPCTHLVCAAPAYLEKQGVPVAPGDLVRHNCLCFGHGARGATWSLEGPNGQEHVTVDGRFRANNGTALRIAVLSGLGLALMPEPVIQDDLMAGRLVAVLPDFRDRSHAVYIDSRTEPHMAPKVQIFVAFVKSYYRSIKPQVT